MGEMNDLNSVLIEGQVIREPLKVGDECILSVSTSRFEKKGDKVLCRTFVVNVVCYDKLAVRCEEFVHAGRRVRVVGRMDLHEIGVGIVVVADHIELRPSFGTEEVA